MRLATCNLQLENLQLETLQTMKYQTRKKAIILLADGTIFHGKSVGNREGSAFGEVFFNTGMTGYEEIFTDPSYHGQIMVATTAHVGNYGVKKEEIESEGVKIAGLVVRNFSYHYSRPGADGSLEEFADKNNLLAISDVDTRALVNYIRDNGAMNAVISTEIDNIESLKKQLAEVPSMEGLELASQVSTKEPYFYGEEDSKYKIAALDVGIKRNILRKLAERDCYIKVFPYNANFEEMQAFEPDGYFISNGPGDPQPLNSAIELVKTILDKEIPLFGICLGHQLLALANGVSTYKMHNGHRGINHPVKNLLTGKGEITSQNHGFAINREEAEANPNIEITHVHLNDHTVAGMKVKNKPAFSVQYHPEASPGPHDSVYLFDQFIEMMENHKTATVDK